MSEEINRHPSSFVVAASMASLLFSGSTLANYNVLPPNSEGTAIVHRMTQERFKDENAASANVSSPNEKESSTALSNVNKQSPLLMDYVVKKCLVDIYDKRIDLDSDNYLKNTIDYARRELFSDADYDNFLRLVRIANNKSLIASLLIYITQLDFSEITAEEEATVFFGLRSNDLFIQEIALNALLVLGDCSDKSKLIDINIENVYLQNDLDEFRESLS